MNNKWAYKLHNYALADTGDYDSYVQFTNGKDILQSSGEDLEEEDLQRFCDLLELMPDLWSHKCDNIAFQNSMLKQQCNNLRGALNEILFNSTDPSNDRKIALEALENNKYFL